MVMKLFATLFQETLKTDTIGILLLLLIIAIIIIIIILTLQRCTVWLRNDTELSHCTKQ